MLKELRKIKGYTQIEFAKKIGEKSSTVCMWEKGKSVPRLSKIKLISQVLEVTEAEVLQSLQNNQRRIK